MSVVGAADGSIIAIVIVSQMPTNQANDPRSVPGPASIPRICWTATAQATSAAASTAVRTNVLVRAVAGRRVGQIGHVASISRGTAWTRRGYPTAVRRYFVTTFGCQMNAHDSERIKGMLEEIGLGEARAADEADVVVFNTCTIREKPDTKLAAYLGEAAARKREHPDRVIAVGGCYAEAQRERIFELYPSVDVAFGPGSIAHLGEWLGAGGMGVPRGRFGLDDRNFAAELPLHNERSFQAWVQVSMGCNSKCSYCIVPAVRGREQSRRPGEIIAEVQRLAAQGVKEVTLLGQNVNSWGRDLLPRSRDRVRRTAPRLRCGRGNRARSVHEPSPEGLPRAGDRGDGGVPVGVRARASAASVRFVAASESDAQDLHARAVSSPSPNECVRPFPTWRSGRTSSSGSRGRPRTTSARRWRWSSRSATTARTPSSIRRAPAPRLPRCRIRSPTR